LTRLNILPSDERSSLFVCSINDEENKFYTINNRWPIFGQAFSSVFNIDLLSSICLSGTVLQVGFLVSHLSVRNGTLGWLNYCASVCQERAKNLVLALSFCLSGTAFKVALIIVHLSVRNGAIC